MYNRLHVQAVLDELYEQDKQVMVVCRRFYPTALSLLGLFLHQERDAEIIEHRHLKHWFKRPTKRVTIVLCPIAVQEWRRKFDTILVIRDGRTPYSDEELTSITNTCPQAEQLIK